MNIRSGRWPSPFRMLFPLMGLLAGLLAPALCGSADAPVVIPAPSVDEKSSGSSETAVLAGGCFWGVQGVFQHVKGVREVLSGYSGGSRGDAEYETVSSGATGHAESVRITFDPRVVSYGRILQVFFSVAHDPTQLDRQGPDHGPQYRSDIFAMDPEQQRVAQRYVAQLSQAGAFPRPIVTKIDLYTGFYAAEGYHQDFATLHPDHPYIAINDLPKIENLRRMFPDLYREKPVLAR